MSSEEIEKYKEILKGTVKESKKKMRELESPNYEKIKELEEQGKNRKTLKKWLDKKIEKKRSKRKEAKKKPKKKVKKRKKAEKVEKIKFLPKKKEVERKKKPKFLRKEFHKKMNLKEKWRRPRGGESKKRLQKRGKGKIPKIGYKNPERKRGLVKGLKPKYIQNPSQLGDISEGEGVIISGKVGRKKRNKIIKRANKLKITILNPKKGEVK